MSLLSPNMLWWGLASVPLLAIYLLKIRPVKKITSTLFLWEEILKKKRRTALFHKLRDLFSFLLMLLIIALVVLAMSNPQFTSTDINKELIVIVDTSLSMQAKEKGGQRIDKAKQKAKDLFKSLALGRRAALMTINHDLRYRVNLTDNQRLLMKEVDDLQHSDCPFRMEALSIFLEDPDIKNKYRIILLSDGCSFKDEINTNIELIKIGSPQENVGIIAFDLMRIPGKSKRLGLFFQIVSTFKEEKTFDVILSYESYDKIMKVCPVTVKPGLNPSEIYTVNQDKPGRWLLTIECDDALEKDNVSYALLGEINPIAVAVNAPSTGYFFRRLVEAFGYERGLMTLVDREPDIVITSGQNIPYVLADKHIIFQPQGKSPFWRSLSTERKRANTVRTVISDHPSIKYCDLESISFAGIKRIVPLKNSLVIVETSSGIPLIYKAFYKQKTAYVINLDPLKSHLFLNTIFPVMVYNMARDLSGQKEERTLFYRPGENIDLNSAGSNENITIISPDNTGSISRSRSYGPLDRMGFYKIEQGGTTNYAACSLAGIEESLLDNSNVKETGRPIKSGWPLRYWLVILALITAAVESILYHRRKVG